MRRCSALLRLCCARRLLFFKVLCMWAGQQGQEGQQTATCSAPPCTPAIHPPPRPGFHRAFARWAKPFNPILGETWEAGAPDGSRIFFEQTSHHPPVSAFQLLGPHGLYVFCGQRRARGRERARWAACAEPAALLVLKSKRCWRRRTCSSLHPPCMLLCLAQPAQRELQNQRGEDHGQGLPLRRLP